MATLFSKIIAGEIPCYKIAETDDCLAFLDISPLNEGHTLCITKKEVDYIFNLDEESYLKLMSFSKRVAAAIEAVVACKRIGVAVIGLEVPHTHVHLVPINNVGDINFAQERKQFTTEEFTLTAHRIAEQFI
jgi:histidine triad (HIT) family protein